VKRPTPPPWKKLYTQATKAKAPARRQQLIDEARCAIFERKLALVGTESFEEETADLDVALRKLWTLENTGGT